MASKILIVDDSLPFLNEAQAVLRSRYDVLCATTGLQCIETLRVNRVSIVLLDLMLPDVSGIDVLSMIHSDIDPHLPVIIVTDHSNVDNAIEAMQRGAADFVPKNFNLQMLHARIERALEHRTRALHLNAHVENFAEQNKDFIFASDAMKKVDMEITRLARFDFDVLVTGETGSGKDKVATQLHLRSNRSHKPFVALPLSTLSETLVESELFGHEKGAFSSAEKAKIGKFEAAHEGTIYIPEVSCLSESMQIKLLSFMQYKAISRVGQDPRKPEIQLDVRLIMASNDDLQALVKDRRLREDFYHRINGVRLHVPPLRERVDDIRHLATHFLEKYRGGQDIRLTKEVIHAMENYAWPGNVRELENAVKNALAYGTGNELTPEHFPHLHPSAAERATSDGLMEDGGSMLPFEDAEFRFRQKYFVRLMQLHNNSVTTAASASGLTPQGLRKILKACDIR